MIGLVIQYTTLDMHSRVKLSHKLFGRIIKTYSGGVEVFYYQKGLLHNIKFKKLLNGKYFIHNIEIKVSLKKLLEEYCSAYKIIEDVRVFTEQEMTTSLEHWMRHASEMNYKVRCWTD